MFGKQKIFSTAGNLVDGLPVPQNTMITIRLESDGFYIQALIGRIKEEWPKFELSLEKVENVQIMNQMEIKQVIEQSAPGMIIGGAALGALGALIGGRVKTKEKVKNHVIFIITYTSNVRKQIILDVSSAIKDSEQVLKRFKELKPVENSTIQL